MSASEEETARMIALGGPKNKALMRNICDIISEQIAPNVEELQDYDVGNVGYMVPIQGCSEHAMRMLESIACPFGSDYAPYIDFADMKNHTDELRRCTDALFKATLNMDPQAKKIVTKKGY